MKAYLDGEKYSCYAHVTLRGLDDVNLVALGEFSGLYLLWLKLIFMMRPQRDHKMAYEHIL